VSFILQVIGGEPITVERWQRRVSTLGARVEFPPGLQLATYQGFLRLAITLENASLLSFPRPERFQRRLKAGFWFGGEATEIVSLTTDHPRTGADFLAQVLCAAAYALEAGARLEDFQEGETFEGDAIVAVLPRLFDPIMFESDLATGEPFTLVT